ncbi:MAG: TRAM domain-containing protein [Armatimonadetes bacterium]|nr:TRAM domain-containing protein [Armatimonadota bacterium]
MSRQRPVKIRRPQTRTAFWVHQILVVGSTVVGAWAAWSSSLAILHVIYDFVVDRLKIGDPTAGFNGANALSKSAIVLLGAMFGAYAMNLVIDRFDRFLDRWDKMEVGERVTIVLGSFAGIVEALPVYVLLKSLDISNFDAAVAFMLMIFGFAVLSVYVLRSLDDMLPWQRRRPGRKSGIKILDTNLFIDGRISEVAKYGFLEGQLYVPQFVLDELQYLADSHDTMKRQRGRRGLEVLKQLKAELPVEVATYDRHAPDKSEPVDSRLVRLAQALGADIVTNDFNLNRVARLQDVRVLNINDLALALRTNIMPQEALSLLISREGNQAGQGVGYLEDGTMVVVDGGKPHMGEMVDVMVTQVIQTERGKMVFAEIEEGQKKTTGRRVH